MLYSLSVSNYILIGSLETSFPEGLVIISGETGAGKSILLGALSLVLGAKADAAMVGPREDTCVVEAEFGAEPEIRRILQEADLPADSDRLILRRTVARSGRSRCFANDEPVSLGVLQELSAHLVDIHSQHQSLKLSDERFRLDALDIRAGAADLRSSCTRSWKRMQEAREQLASLRERLAAARAEEDYNRTRSERLQEAALQEGELEALESEEKQLAHAGEIKETLCAVDHLLNAEENSPARQLRESERLLEKAARFVPGLEDLVQRLGSARVELEDIADEVAAVSERTEVSPRRLEAVQERLSLLYSLLQKHGAATVAELIAERDRLLGLVRDASELEGAVESARKELEECTRAYETLSDTLHRKRQEAAPALSAEITAQLHRLELEQAEFCVEVTDAAPGPLGHSGVRFLFAPLGDRPSDAAKTASGGELSRIMLGLKAIMARFRRMPTLVFDEIDTGVSGSAADKMGSLVCAMGKDMQVFAITHLPQVAAKGNAHYLVSKSGAETSVRALDGEGRVKELARMLSGSTITPEAVANARSLLKSASDARR